MANLTLGKRALLLLDDDSNVLWPAYIVTSSDPTIVDGGDGGAYRIAAISASLGTATLTITRQSDGATFDLEITVVPVPGPDPQDPFTVHLGAEY